MMPTSPSISGSRDASLLGPVPSCCPEGPVAPLEWPPLAQLVGDLASLVGRRKHDDASEVRDGDSAEISAHEKSADGMRDEMDASISHGVAVNS